MKIGIFGGCFNPPHKMHKEIANKLIDEGYLDKVIFVPTGNNYEKVDLIDIDQRIHMIKLMLHDENIMVSDISKDSKYQYTFEVLDFYKARYPEAAIYFICGTDNLDEFDTWKKYEYIMNKYKLLVVMRNEDNIDEIMTKYSKYKDSICVANIAQNPISSTLVRESIKEGKRDKLSKYVDERVLEYILSKGLYKD